MTKTEDILVRYSRIARNWYVYGTPVKGYFPEGAAVDRLTGYASKVVVGPFDTAVQAALFIEARRPVEQWQQVNMYSNVSGRKSKAGA